MRRFLIGIVVGAILGSAFYVVAWPRPDVQFFGQGNQQEAEPLVTVTPGGATPTPVVTNTPAATNTPQSTWTPGATNTATPVATATPTPVATNTPGGFPLPTCTSDNDCKMGCCGDCNQNGITTVAEVTVCLDAFNLNGGIVPGNCAACDCDGNGVIEVNDLLLMNDRALNGCPITGTCP